MEAAPSSSAEPPDEEHLEPPRCGIAAQQVAIVCFSSFLLGYSICVLDTCGELIPVVFGWCNSKWQSDCLASRVCQGFLSACLYLGAAFGAILSNAPVFPVMGSRVQLIVSDVFFAAGAFLCSNAQGFEFLVFGRLASGVAVGLVAIQAPLFIQEASPKERRSCYGAFHGVFIAVGIVFSLLLGMAQDPPPSGPNEPLQGINMWYWRVLLGFPALPALVQGSLFYWVLPVDPPPVLLLRGKVREAREILYNTYGLTLKGECADLTEFKIRRIEQQLNFMCQAAVEFRSVTRRTMCGAFVSTPYLRCAMLIGLILASLQQLCGINAIMAFSNSLFREAGVAPTQLTIASACMATANVLVAMMTVKVIDQWGRRRLLLLGTFLQALSMFAVVVLSRHWSSRFGGIFVVAAFTVFVAAYSIGLGAVTWLYLSDIFPVEIRNSGFSTCGALNWFASFIIVFLAKFLTLHSVCKLFGIISAAGWLFIYIWVIDTKSIYPDITPRTPTPPSLLVTPPPTMFEPQEDRPRRPLLEPLQSSIRYGLQPDRSHSLQGSQRRSRSRERSRDRSRDRRL